jgi:uncharacterized membrane protein YdjX (TVP38/TMEM64 family)
MSFTTLKAQEQIIRQLMVCSYSLVVVAYILLYSTAILFMFPVTAPLTIMGGYLFSTVFGALYAIIAATLGAIAAFLVFRYFLTDFVKERYGQQLQILHKQFERYGAVYLLLLHFLTIVPFFIINILAAVAHVSLTTFIWTTIVGITPLLSIYAFMGDQLQRVGTISDIISPKFIAILIIFIALVISPILIRTILKRWGKQVV